MTPLQLSDTQSAYLKITPELLKTCGEVYAPLNGGATIYYKRLTELPSILNFPTDFKYLNGEIFIGWCDKRKFYYIGAHLKKSDKHKRVALTHYFNRSGFDINKPKTYHLQNDEHTFKVMLSLFLRASKHVKVSFDIGETISGFCCQTSKLQSFKVVGYHTPVKINAHKNTLLHVVNAENKLFAMRCGWCEKNLHYTFIYNDSSPASFFGLSISNYNKLAKKYNCKSVYPENVVNEATCIPPHSKKLV